MEEQEFSVSIYCSEKQQLLWSEQKQGRACGGSFPTKGQILLAGEVFKDAPGRKRVQVSALALGTVSHVTELSQ